MGDHFRLEVEPDLVAGAARHLGRFGESLRTRGQKTGSAPGRWASGWKCASATAIGEEATALGGHLGDFADHFDHASAAVSGFAEDLDHAADVEIPSLNRRWDAASTAYDAAIGSADSAYRRGIDGLGTGVPPQIARMERDDLGNAASRRRSDAAATRDATHHKLELEYDDLCDRLDRRARRLATTLSESVAVPVPPALVSAYVLAQGSPIGRLLWGAGGDLAVDLATRAEQELDGPLGTLQRDLQSPPGDVDEIRALLQRARDLGVPPDQYAPTLEAFWIGRAAEDAGIDLSQWDPTLGAEANREIIEAVYTYYGKLYLADEDLQWAGMANMIGPSFAAGFFDLTMFRRIGETAGNLPEPLRSALPQGVDSLADLSAEEMRFYETTFLDMQQQIFFDQGSMHQAYVDGGLPAIEEMLAAGLISQETADGWADVDSGVPARVAAGNTQFLHREQFEIINDEYRAMYNHSPTGPAMTWAMTLIGTPSIERADGTPANGYPDVFPLTIDVETPGPENVGTPHSIFGQEIPHVSVDNPVQGEVHVETPFPDGNIADFDDRWALIEQDTLPAYQDLLATNPDRAREIVGSDVGDRIADYRIYRRVDDILGQMLDWQVDFDQ